MDMTGIGILGAGLMAERMAKTIAMMEGVKIQAVAARELDRARSFASRHAIGTAYGSYHELVSDPLVELVYIATPNTLHYEHCKLCLEHGKHVLCEKPFTIASAEAREIFAISKRLNLLAAEAMWTRFMPFSATIRDMLENGIIGRRVFLSANMGNDVWHMERLREPSLGGGALLDLGVYTLAFAAMFIDEKPEKIVAARIQHETGVDAQNTVSLSYRSGAMASLSSTMMTATEKRGAIYGEKGFLVVDNINNPTAAHLFSSDRKFQETFLPPKQISGLEYEILSAIKAVHQGKIECPEMTHEATLATLTLVEAIQESW